jgi:membrane fusion protein, multidrug efflux system
MRIRIKTIHSTSLAFVGGTWLERVGPLFKNRFAGLIGWLKRHPLIGTALGLLLVYLAYEFCTTFLIVCRDAYVTADIVTVAPQVSGPMLRLAVTDNQSVESGDPLFTIDPRPFQIELDREKAALGLAQANLGGAKDRLALAQSNIDAKQATSDDATINRDRGLQLRKENVVSQETVDNLERSFKVAQAELAQARAAKVVAEQDVAVQNAEIQGVETAVAKAEWELSKTEIKSPASGRVAPFLIRPGTFLEVGKPVLAIVTADNWRIMANLPERHLSGLHIGQSVWVSMGSDPWRVYTGHVRSIAPGVARSANSVNVLPYVEPTTEWIRLPRRFPVEIDLNDLPDKKDLFLGSNATVWWIQP